MNIHWLLIFSFVFSFAISLSTIPILLKLSHKFKWYDFIDERKIHKGNIPRIAGVAIFLSFLITLPLAYFLYGDNSYVNLLVPFFQILPILLGSLIIHLLGLFDDFSNIRARYKFIGQIIAAFIVIAGGYRIEIFTLPYLWIDIPLGSYSLVITLLWIVAVTNAINFMDGLDGLAAGIAAIAGLFMGIFYLLQPNFTAALIAFILTGSALGYLKYNFPPAKIFMGDSGSTLLGFLLSIIPLLNSTHPLSTLTMTPAILLLLIPLMDTLAAILRRIKKRESPLLADRQHLHHKLLNFGLSNKKILAIVYGINVGLGLLALLCLIPSNTLIMTIFFIGFFLITGLFIWLHFFNKRWEARKGSGPA